MLYIELLSQTLVNETSFFVDLYVYFTCYLHNLLESNILRWGRYAFSALLLSHYVLPRASQQNKSLRCFLYYNRCFVPVKVHLHTALYISSPTWLVGIRGKLWPEGKLISLPPPPPSVLHRASTSPPRLLYPLWASLQFSSIYRLLIYLFFFCTEWLEHNYPTHIV